MVNESLRAREDDRTKILLAHLPERVHEFFRGQAYNVVASSDWDESIHKLRDLKPDLVVAPAEFESPSGKHILDATKEVNSSIGVILIASNGDDVRFHDFVSRGAKLYPMTKPLENILPLIEEVLRDRPAEREKLIRFENIVGASPQMQSVFRTINRVAAIDRCVLIIGETGTGKQCAAQVIHRLSRRKHKPFELVHCEVSPDAELESEIFGHEPRAFPWAVEPRSGRLEMADGGTLYLAEVTEMPMTIQAKLLRFLEKGRFQRLGGERELTADVRIIAACTQSLDRKIGDGAFLEKLRNCLASIQISMPTLRERPLDIRELVAHFLKREQVWGEIRIHEEAMDALMNYSWPGNVAQLQRVIENACAACERNWIRLQDLPLEIRRFGPLA